MQIITLDFETYFDDEYSLKKMTTEAYVRDPRFETLGVSIDWRQYPDARCSETVFYGGTRKEIQDFLWQVDWEHTACLCHHAQFDGLILNQYFDARPRAWLDTLSMARLMLGNHLSVSLGSLANHYGLSAKSIDYSLFKGKHWCDLSPDVQRAVGDGCIHDVELTAEIFSRLMRGDT